MDDLESNKIIKIEVQSVNSELHSLLICTLGNFMMICHLFRLKAYLAFVPHGLVGFVS